jgi:hypothetical protein
MNYASITTRVGRKYFSYWKNGLKTILGWSDQQIEEWAEQFKGDLNAEDSLFFHFNPGDYLVPVLVSPTLLQKAAARGSQAAVISEVADAVSDFLYPELWEGEGWSDAKSRVESLLQRLGKEYS